MWRSKRALGRASEDRTSWGRAVALASGLLPLGVALSACGGDAVERAAQSARLAALEETVRQLGENIAALKAAPAPAPVAEPHAAPPQVFQVACPQPWVLHAPVGANLWTCRSPIATPDAYFPQCSVVFQPQIAIETKDYFEFALNAAPELRAIKNVKDQRTKLHDADAFEATFEAERKPLPLKALGVLLPHGEVTYAITCIAPSASFGSYSPAFRKIIETFAFN